MSKNNITNAIIAVTNKCNARCIMCNIWNIEAKDELTPEDFLKLPKTLKDINLTGGEPFLRTDIVDIAANITKVCPKTRIIFSSNGFLTEKITRDMTSIKKINPNLAISLSLDGIEEMHAEIRGIENAYQKVINTAKSLKSSGINDIRFAFTASEKNISHLSRVYDLSKKMQVELTLCIVHNSDNYYGIQSNQVPDFEELKEHLTYVTKKENKCYNLRRLLRSYYIEGILEYVKTGKRPLKCYAIDNSFFMDAKGDIYPCNILETKIGNIKENDFDVIWDSEKVEKLKKICENCNKCWTVCNVKNAILKHPLKPINKVIWNKINSFISSGVLT